MVKFTEIQKGEALKNAQQALAARREASKHIRHNSFSGWGNRKCISRIIGTIEAMENGYASEAQYRYWLSH